MLDEEYAHLCAIRFLTLFEQAIHAAISVQPTKRPFSFPTLATVPFFQPILRRTAQRLCDMDIAIRRNGHDAALAQSPAMGFTIIAFVQAQALGPSEATANPNAIDRFQ